MDRRVERDLARGRPGSGRGAMPGNAGLPAAGGDAVRAGLLVAARLRLGLGLLRAHAKLVGPHLGRLLRGESLPIRPLASLRGLRSHWGNPLAMPGLRRRIARRALTSVDH